MRLFLVLTLLPLACYGGLCPKGEYWSTFSEICLKCTQCKTNQIVIRNCQSHKDTLCSLSISTDIKKTNFEKSISNVKKNHHFEKGKLHFLNYKDTDGMIDNLIDTDLKQSTLHLEGHSKHGNILKNNNNKHDITKQRINDKYLKWDNDDDDEEDDDDDDDDDDEEDDDEYYDYDIKKHKKHNPLKVNHHNTFKKNEHHHYSFSDLSDEYYDEDEYYDDDDDEEEEEEDEEDEDEKEHLNTLLEINSKTKGNTKKRKDGTIKDNKKHNNNNKKKSDAQRLAQLEDEKKLEEWLIQSRKQFKDRKDNLLKTLKEEQVGSLDSDKRVRLNYPVLNTNNADDVNNKFNKPHKYSLKNNNNSAQHKHNMQSEVELFKELIKNEESQGIELETLMSNKKDQQQQQQSVLPTHRMFLGEPSDMVDDISAHIKDPQEVIKEEMGRNIIYEKSKFSVVPVIKNGDGDVVTIPFTAAERLVWDWQAVAFVSAVSACLLFFLVVGIFILFNARQWRKEKHIYNPECEEMSTRIALIQPTADESNTRYLQFLSLNHDDSMEQKLHPDIPKVFKDSHRS